MKIVLMIALTASGLLAGAILQSAVSACRVREMQDQINGSIPVKDLLYFLHQQVQPRTMKGSDAWNAAIYDIEEWARSWIE